jgi:hypothetical protein
VPKIESWLRLWRVVTTFQPNGAPKREGVSYFRDEVRFRVRFLGIVRVLVCLGGRSTCVDAFLGSQHKIWGIS